MIGSSNASADGLGFEGAETRGLVEANILVEDDAIVDAVERWFEKKVRKGARPITDADLKQARALWADRRRRRPLPKTSSVLDGLKRDENLLRDRDLHISVYEHEDQGTEADEIIDREREEQGDNSIYGWLILDRKSILSPGAYVVDFDLRRKIPRFDGFYRVLHENRVRKLKSGTLLLCREVEGFEGLSWGSQDIWKKAAVRACRETSSRLGEWEFTAEKFAKFLLTEM